MRRSLALIFLAALAAACNTTAYPDTTKGPADTTGTMNVLSTAIRSVLDESGANLETKDLVYVVGPSTELWDQWCGFDTGEPGEEPHDEVPSACGVLDSTTFDLPATYQGDTATEIENALAPITVEFIEDPDSVIGTLDEGMMIAPIEGDAGLLTFGVIIEADGKAYLPVDAHGEGWLFELTPSSNGDGTWDIQPIAAYIA